MNPVKDVVEGKILSEMKKYRQSNSFAATTTGCDTGFEYLKQLWNKTEKTEEKKGEER